MRENQRTDEGIRVLSLDSLEVKARVIQTRNREQRTQIQTRGENGDMNEKY